MYYSTTSSFTPPAGTEFANSLGSGDTGVVVTGLATRLRYHYFKVAAVNSGVVGIYSAAATMATIPAVNYDVDGDGLIDVTTLDQLDAMRYDLDGNGISWTNQTKYGAAFPATAGGNDYSDVKCSNGTPVVPCTGYELLNNLDFAATKWENPVDGTFGDTRVTGGWQPIGDGFGPNEFTATFEGNSHTISNLYISRASQSVGLFGSMGAGAKVRNVGVVGGSVTTSSASGRAGGLVGRNKGTITGCYATGAATGNQAGGLVGE